MDGDALPVVSARADVETHATRYVTVEGVYEQQDVRMKQVDPAELFKGHAAIVLSDGERVYLYPQQDAEAIRPADERERLEHRRVRASGLLLPTNPREGAVITAPCLIDLRSIDLAAG
jgi:hypothetical protein